MAKTQDDLDPRLLSLIQKVTAKRARIVIDHILAHGQISTEELKDKYGYNHPPRAARDVREEGIPLKTIRVSGSDGRRIGAYTFGNLDSVERHKLGGRKIFSKEFKRDLLSQFDSCCGMCSEPYADRYLQIDHRVPYEVAGETLGDESQQDLFMPICGTCNRKKSWSCEHCTNWTTEKAVEMCNVCYWASPEDYTHMALRRIRRLEIVWSEDEVVAFDRMAKAAQAEHVSVQAYVKQLLVP